MNQQFPRTQVAGISLPRMIIGTNWLLGYSHRSKSQDDSICERYANAEDYVPVLEAFLENDINAVMAPAGNQPNLIKAIRLAEDKTGKEIILIDTPGLNVDDTPEGRREAEKAIQKSAKIGATFCLIHHGSCEQLIDKNKQSIRRLDDYTKMIRDNGLIPGLSAHMPEIVLYSDLNHYDVETYIQIYNCMGFLMQVEVETVARIINNAKKPVMTIKPFAAGRTTPYVGLNFCYNTIRECDVVTVGAGNAREAKEDIEIGLAAIERRYPNLEGRSSPVAQSVHHK